MVGTTPREAMEAQQIRNATQRLARSVDWIRPGGEDWTFVGLSQEFQEAEVQRRVDGFFAGEKLYLVFGRRDAAEVPRAGVAHVVGELLMVREVSLWDAELGRTMQFNRLGLSKAGVVRAQK
jgi:hypothetical protein